MRRFPLFVTGAALLALAAPSARAHESGKPHPHPEPEKTAANAPQAQPSAEEHDHDHDGDGDQDHEAHEHEGSEPWARAVVLRSVRSDTIALSGGLFACGVYVVGTRRQRRRDGGKRQ